MDGPIPTIIGIVVVSMILLYAYDRWIRPRLARNWIDETLKQIRSGNYKPPPKLSNIVISTEAEGMSLSRIGANSTWLQFVAWSDVVRVSAFKRDLFTVDCICLAIASRDGMTTEVNEEMEGWEALNLALPTYLPGAVKHEDWFCQVAFPAFASMKRRYFPESKRDGCASG